VIKTYYQRKAAECYQLYRAAMEDEDFKTAEYYFGEYENYTKGGPETGDNILC
jgi:hypothetical protein